MHTDPSRENHRERRKVELFDFGCIEYEPGANYVSGSFELTAFPVATDDVANTGCVRERRQANPKANDESSGRG